MTTKTWTDYFNEGVAQAINEQADGPEKQAFLGTLLGALGGGMVANNFLGQAAKQVASHTHPIMSKIPIVKHFVRKGVERNIRGPAIAGGSALGAVAGKKLIDDDEKTSAEVAHPDHRFTSARGTVLTELATRGAHKDTAQSGPSLADLLPAPEAPKEAGARLPTNAAPPQKLIPAQKLKPWKPVNRTMGSMHPKTAGPFDTQIQANNAALPAPATIAQRNAAQGLTYKPSATNAQPYTWTPASGMRMADALKGYVGGKALPAQPAATPAAPSHQTSTLGQAAALSGPNWSNAIKPAAPAPAGRAFAPPAIQTTPVPRMQVAPMRPPALPKMSGAKTAMDPITLATLAALAFGGFHGGRAAAKGRVSPKPGLHQPVQRFQHHQAAKKSIRRGGLVGAALGTGLGGYHAGKEDAQPVY